MSSRSNTPFTHPGLATSFPGIPSKRIAIVGALDWVRRMLADALRDDDVDPIDAGDPEAPLSVGDADAWLFDARVDPDAALGALERLRRRDWATPALFL